MGLMPPYDPFGDAALAWAICRVRSIDPPNPTWSRPARVVLDVTERLRGDVPSSVEVTFGQTREAAQSYFYAARGMSPVPTPEEQADYARQAAMLDATPVEVPSVGATIIVWLARTPHGPAPGPPLPGEPLGSPTSSEWDVPTLRSMGMPVPGTMRSRWLEADAATIALVRQRIG